MWMYSFSSSSLEERPSSVTEEFYSEVSLVAVIVNAIMDTEDISGYEAAVNV
jgi:hypothetical protein